MILVLDLTCQFKYKIVDADDDGDDDDGEGRRVVLVPVLMCGGNKKSPSHPTLICQNQNTQIQTQIQTAKHKQYTHLSKAGRDHQDFDGLSLRRDHWP